MQEREGERDRDCKREIKSAVHQKEFNLVKSMFADQKLTSIIEEIKINFSQIWLQRRRNSGIVVFK